MSLNVTITGVKGLMRVLDEKKWRVIIIAQMAKAGSLVRVAAASLAPVDTGTLRRSITSRVIAGISEVVAEIGSPMPYAPFMEFGTGLMTTPTRPRHFPPAAALHGWALRHGFPNGFVVARAIARRGGLMPRRFMLGGLNMKRTQVWRQIVKILDGIAEIK